MGSPYQVGEELEQFACAMYGRGCLKSVDGARAAILKEKYGNLDGSINLSRNIDFNLVPPCSKALLKHIRRANYQAGIWKAADIPRPREPQTTDGHGWTIIDGNLRPR